MVNLKKILVAGALGAMLSLPTMLSNGAGITGSAHDFQSKSWNTRQTVCSVCHTMHNSLTPQIIPLWGHATTTASFTPYSSGSLNATIGQPTGASLACLSCHDGTVAVNNYGGRINGSAEYVTGDANLGIDLSNDHPISFVYDAALATADGYLNDPTTYLVTGPDFSGTKTINQEMLRNNRVECSSCHDIHKQRGASKTSGLMLVMSGSAYAGSKLCLTCHIK